MLAEDQRTIRTSAFWGLVVFLFINAFSWNPGWGGRNDRKPGREIERYFGWPSCFYCDLWRSDHDHQIAPASYFPPIPLSREMYFVYFSGSVLALLLNVTLVACGVGICITVVLAERSNPNKWMRLRIFGMAIVVFLIIVFGDEFSAYL